MNLPRLGRGILFLSPEVLGVTSVGESPSGGLGRGDSDGAVAEEGWSMLGEASDVGSLGRRSGVDCFFGLGGRKEGCGTGEEVVSGVVEQRVLR